MAKSGAAKKMTAKQGPKKTPRPKAQLKAVAAQKSLLPKEIQLTIYELMVKSRALEERLIKIYRSGESFFWIGGPGEEAFGVPLGLLVHKGQGPKHDYLHLHYRGTPTLIAMGLEVIDSVRLIMNRATDPSTGGRNFSNHYCFPQWNVVPVSSPIEVQYSMAIGTGLVQKRKKSKGISIVTGGDAGTAEGDFASSLVWSTRPGSELPLLLTVQNNRWGISTDYDSQHGEKHVADRGKAFGMRTRVINGNDPEESYLCLKEEMDYIRKTGKPVLLEAKVSRLFGHSSASGANLAKEEEDPLRSYEELLFKRGVLKPTQATDLMVQFENECRQAQEQVRLEAPPEASTVWDHVYTDSENADWRSF